MISLEEAIARVLAGVEPGGEEETIPASEALGRTLAWHVIANRTQPPSDMSAMDGYAVRVSDLHSLPVTLPVVGKVPAGTFADFEIKPGEAGRIFTGGTMPTGADTVVIQENTEASEVDGGVVTILKAPKPFANVRERGFDFFDEEELISIGETLNAKDLALTAAANVAEVSVFKRPKVAYLATGDELVPVGTKAKDYQIINSNGPLMAGLVTERGGEPIDLGIAPDEPEALKALLKKASGADVIVTLGGASVGDHDIVQACLEDLGFKLDFWKVNIKPGKPVMFGHMNGTPVLGLPGNPSSAFVCAILLLFPLLDTLLGKKAIGLLKKEARLRGGLPKNGPRECFLRAGLEENEGSMVIYPLPTQDSSALLTLSEASALLIRPPNAPEASTGDLVEYLPI